MSSLKSCDVLTMFCFTVLILLSSIATRVSSTSLTVGFYQKSCPSAEAIVSKTVSRNPGFGPALIRMYFHDCFVRGCDASVLLESTPGNKAEKDHPINNLRGFEVINEAKSEIEKQCPNTVSCADIIAFAARDISYEMGNIHYDVPSGRRDGLVSNYAEVGHNLLRSTSTSEQMVQNFAQKGLSVDELVTLLGAHSIGAAHCSSFINRLYNFSATHDVDPSLDPEYAAFLKTKCRPNGVDTKISYILATTEHLDNGYYIGLLKNRGLLGSDQSLTSNPVTQKMVLANARDGETWAKKFAKAMVRMGTIDVLTGTQGQIRKHCSFVN